MCLKKNVRLVDFCCRYPALGSCRVCPFALSVLVCDFLARLCYPLIQTNKKCSNSIFNFWQRDSKKFDRKRLFSLFKFKSMIIGKKISK